MKKLLTISSVFVFAVLMMSIAVVATTTSGAIGEDYNIKGNLDESNINVFNSKVVIPWEVSAEGYYVARYNEGKAKGRLVINVVGDNTDDDLSVQWNSESWGVEMTQDDQYAVKFIANAKVSRSNQLERNERVYVHYNRITEGLVVRGPGFRFVM